MVSDALKDSTFVEASFSQFDEALRLAGKQSLEGSGELSQGEIGSSVCASPVGDVVPGLHGHGLDPSGNQSCRVSISSQKAGS